MEQTKENFTDFEHNLKVFKKIKKFGLTSERFKYIEMGSSAEEETNDAKLKQRSNLKLEEWGKYEYYKDDWCEKILQTPWSSNLKVAIEDYDSLSEESFREKYERLSLPLIIKGATKHWEGSKTWNFKVT